MSDAKLTAALDRVETAARVAASANLGGAILTLSNAAKALKRIAERAEANDEWEEIECVQFRGPTVRFKGRRLAWRAWQIRNSEQDMEIEIWETPGGALVALSSSVPRDGNGFVDLRVKVVAPTPDIQAMHFAVMDHFNWANEARSMVRKLDWDLSLSVD